MFNQKIVGTCLLVLLAAPAIIVAQTAPVFFVRNYGGKCLDFGAPPQAPGSPVFIYNCNGTAAQQVRVEEINDRHEVMLRAGSQVIGVKDIPPDNTTGSTTPAADHALTPEMPLELQNQARATVLARRQIFALDGDSILLAENHNLVVKVPNGRGANRTPLVLGQRNLTDSEFWGFSSPGSPGLRPTKGFVRVPQDTDLMTALSRASWGTVIEIAAGTSIDLTNVPTLMIPAGVTIRGDRRGLMPGPEVFGLYSVDMRMFETAGEAVRITGLRLRGPSPSTSGDLPTTSGIVVHEKFSTIIDNNELSHWTSGAVTVDNDNVRDHRFPRLESIRILRNFIHHNQREGLGYGVDVGNGAFAAIDGNVFISNRHAITSGGGDFTGYRARNNLVLFATPSYGLTNHVEQDFDVHGTLDTCGQHCGGQAGEYFEIAQNTFLGGNRLNFRLRGTPTRGVDFHDNILVGSCVSFPPTLLLPCDALKDEVNSGKLTVLNNRFEAPNPTARLGVGQFDGDQNDDLFLATGAGWYYAPAGAAEWRFLSNHRETIDQLLFGDFNGDGRTDVLTQHGRDLLVSWSGTSPWEKINETEGQISDLAIGDFDGDGHADVFYADGHNWQISRGGVGAFELLGTSGSRTGELRFGDFNGDGQTDVFSIAGNEWKISDGGTSLWKPGGSRPANSIGNPFVGDFNGDGRADVAIFTGHSTSSPFWIVPLQLLLSGANDWTTVRIFNSLPWALPWVAATGRFDGNPSADMLLWHDDYLDILSGPVGLTQRQSRQDMR